MSAAPQLVIHRDKQVLADASAARLVIAILDAQAARGTADIVLTGGSMGSAILVSLGASPASAAIDWGNVSIWWGDERFLAAGDPDRNETQAREALLDSLPLDPGRVHAMPASNGPDGDVDSAAETYATELASAAHRADGARASSSPPDAAFRGSGPDERALDIPVIDVPAFDVVMLGVGPDCHIASLFPEHPALQGQHGSTVGVHNSPKPPPLRVSLTFAALRSAKDVWFLVSGADKADAVALAFSGAGEVQAPAGSVKGHRSTLWLVDMPAAARLTQPT